MIEQSDDETPASANSPHREADLAAEPAGLHTSYLRRIDIFRKVVAVAMVVCGIGFGVCVNRDDFLRGTLRQPPGFWAWGIWPFGIGVAICLIATVAFVVEYFARPYLTGTSGPRQFTQGSLLVLFGVCRLSRDGYHIRHNAGNWDWHKCNPIVGVHTRTRCRPYRAWHSRCHCHQPHALVHTVRISIRQQAC